MEIKLNNVYNFHYNEEYLQKISYPYHCFDGQLIVKQDNGENLYLEDTYWNTGENKIFTLEEALQKGTLTFVCNLDNVEKIEAQNTVYYDDEDIFDLSTQHRCYRAIYKRKTANKSVSKMEQVLEDKIAECQNEIKFNQNQIEWANKQLEKLKNGNIDEVYI